MVFSVREESATTRFMVSGSRPVISRSLNSDIRELEKIEMIRQADGVYRLDHAVTKTQKVILSAFGWIGIM